MAVVRHAIILSFLLFLYGETSGEVPRQQPSEPLDKDVLAVLGMYPVNGTLIGSRIINNSELGCVIYAVFSKDPVFSRERHPDNSDHLKATTTNRVEAVPNSATLNVFAIPRCSVAEISSASTRPPGSLFGLKWHLYRGGEHDKRVALGKIRVREEPPRPWHEFGSDYFGHYSITVSQLASRNTGPLELCAARRGVRICIPLVS